MNPYQHLELLLRFNRTFNLKPLVESVVQSGDRVLDAGCGLGLISHWAVAAGAKHVDAVDLADLAVASRIAADNRRGDQITFQQADLKQWVMDPEKQGVYDCIFAMIYLNDPRRDEGQIELTQQIQSALLKPGGRLVPDQVIYHAALLDWPEQEWDCRQRVISDSVTDLEARYDIDFSGLRAHLATTPYKSFFPARGADGNLALQGARFLTDKTDSFTIDYSRSGDRYPESIHFEIRDPGRANVLLWWQSLVAMDRLIFTNQSVSWITNPRNVNAGESVQVPLDSRWRQSNLVDLK